MKTKDFDADLRRPVGPVDVPIRVLYTPKNRTVL